MAAPGLHVTSVSVALGTTAAGELNNTNAEAVQACASVTVTVYEPAAKAVIVEAVAPFDQVNI